MQEECEGGGVLICTFHPLVSSRGHRMKAMAELADVAG